MTGDIATNVPGAGWAVRPETIVPSPAAGARGDEAGAATRFYSPELDGLRFVAALLVFLHHAPALPYLGALKDHGWVGVDLFLVLSAFLITRLILLEIDRTGRLDLRAFYVRRILRIWPLYLGYATASALFALLIAQPSATTVAAWWFSHLTFSANLMTAIQGYSPVFASGHLWTIALEEQAYLILPLALPLLAASARRLRTACIAAGAVLTLLFGVRIAFVLADVAHPFVWTMPLRADAFAIGMVAALVSIRISPLHIATMLLALVALMVATGSPESAMFQLVGYPLVAAALAVLLLACREASMANAILSARPLRYLGKISFGIYIFHFAALAVVMRGFAWLGVDEPLLVVAAGLAGTVAIAALAYRFYEMPFLRMKVRYARVESRPL